MMQASLIKVSLLATLLGPFLTSQDISAHDPILIACQTHHVTQMPALNYDEVTVADLERFAAHQHPDALYWLAMQAERKGDRMEARNLLIQSGQAGSTEAWLRLSDMARQSGHDGQSLAYKNCAEA
ncbi:MAG: hypothetical protein AAF926_09295 [Pseudomonadota bacterium]